MSLSLLSDVSIKAVYAAAAVAAVVLYLLKRKTPNLPPSPPGNFVLGHALKLPATHQWETLAAWGKKYGDLLYLHALGRPMIICNSYETANGLLENRSSIYSDRPPIKSAELIGMGSMLVLLRYNDQWKRQRRAIQGAFDQQASYAFRPSIHEETDRFLLSIIDFQGDIREKIHRFVASVVITGAYGHKVMSDDDVLIKQMEHATHVTTSVGSPGATPVDFFPILQYLPLWLPGTRLLRLLKEGKAYIEQALESPLGVVRKEMEAGISRPSFLPHLLEKYDEDSQDNQLTKEDIVSLGGMVFIAGAETSESTLYAFFVYMILYPNVVKRARQELDSFFDKAKRLPMLSDKAHLPYIGCIVKEVYRLLPATPLGIPHSSMQEDTYSGYTIPVGSMVVPNVWQIMRDERYYPDPEKFMPERHLEVVQGIRPYDPAADPMKAVFGFGRRICPGRFFADDIIWLTVASVLSLFDVLPAVDSKTGKDILPSLELISGTTIIPKPFGCRIVPRSDAHRAMVQGLQGL